MPYSKRSSCAGFTLIETMVAAVILGMTITAVTTMIGVGTGVQSQSGLRRQARMLAANTLEQQLSSNPNYANPGSSGTANTNLMAADGTHQVPAQVTTTVFGAANSFFRDALGGPGILVPFKTIRVHVTWTFDTKPDSVTLLKTIADVQ